MAANEHVGRAAGLAVSLGIGIAVAVGGIGEAAADPADSSSSAGSADSDSNNTSNRSSSGTESSSDGARSSTDDSSSGPSAQSAGNHSLRTSGSQSRFTSESSPRAESAAATEYGDEAEYGDESRYGDEPDYGDEPGYGDEPEALAETDESTEDAVERLGSGRASQSETAEIPDFSDVPLPDAEQFQNAISPTAQEVPAPDRQLPLDTQALSSVLGAARRASDQPQEFEAPAAQSTGTTDMVATEPISAGVDQVATAATVQSGQTPGRAASISSVNSAPTATATVAAPDGVTGVTRVSVVASDMDNDALTYTASRPTWGWVSNLGDGNFTYSTNEFVRLLARFLPFINSDRFSVKVSDGQGGTTSVQVNTTVVPLNSAPVVRSRNVGAPNAASGIVTGAVKAADPNWDSLSYIESTTVTDKGTVSVKRGGGFTYTPNAAARHAAAATSATAADKTDSFKVQVVDKHGALTEIPVNVAIGPVNAAPTGSSTVGSPDALTGITMGTVIGQDADSDPLNYSGSTTTLKGTFTVNADGSFTYTPTAHARYNAWHPYATASDSVDAVSVTVDDGHGGSIAVPVRVEISPSDQAPPPLPDSTFCGCTLMPADTIFHADVRGLPLLPESDKFIELLGGGAGGTLKSGMAAKEWMGSTGGGLPVNVVEASHPKETVIFNRGYSTSGPGIDDRPYAIPDRPLVEGMPSVPAWDRHLFVFQKGTCVSQELINVANGVELPDAGLLDALGNAAYRAIWGDQWIAGAGAQYDMSSHLYPEIGWANASRLPFMPMLLRPDDLERGEIDHMLGLVIAADRGAGFTWPARAGDGTSPDGVPMGTVFRLNSDFDITPYSRGTQIVLRGLQVHGAVIYDSGPAGPGASLGTMSTGWVGTEHLVAAQELNTIPIEAFEVVDVSSIAVDPSIGWQIS